jgi:hypothetical protein
MLLAGSLEIQVPMRSLNVLEFTKSFQLHYDPGVNSASKKNEYRNIFHGEKSLRESKAVSRLSRKCGILDISKFYRPPRNVAGTAFFKLKALVVVALNGVRRIDKGTYISGSTRKTKM